MIPRWLPGRVTAAWAVLGSAAGVALMYSPSVYEGRCSDSRTRWGHTYLSRMGTYYTDGRVRVLGEVAYEEECESPYEVRPIVDAWRLWVAIALAGLGGSGGAILGWREQRRADRRSDRRLNGWLWLPAAGGVFGLVAVAGIPGEDSVSLWGHAREFWSVAGSGGNWTLRDWTEAGIREVTRLAVPAVVIGWAVQVAAAARGVRWSVGRYPDQAADYADGVAGSACLISSPSPPARSTRR